MWRPLVLVAVLARVAAADCGESDDVSLRDEVNVPLDAHIIVARHGPFHLRGDARVLPEQPVDGTALVELAPGLLNANTHYVVLDANGGRVAAFTTDSSFDLIAPSAPDAAWSQARDANVSIRDRRDDDVVAYIATLVGPRERQSYLIKVRDRVSGYTLLTRACLERAGVVVGGLACIDLVAIDRAGHRSPATNVCGPLGAPRDGYATDLQLDLHSTPPIALTLQRRSDSGNSPWPVFGAIALAIFGWSRLRRMHALRRYRRASICEADRPATLRALGRMRVLLLVAASCSFLTFTIAGAIFDLTAQPGAWLAIVFVPGAVLSVRATWRVHVAIERLAAPEGVAVIDPGGYLFVRRGSDAPIYVPTRRATLAELANALPAARVVRQ